MRFSPALRKAIVTVHVVTAVGWLGAEAVLLVLAVAGRSGADPAVVYPAIGLIGSTLVVPLAVAAWTVGVVTSLGTPWGLVRHRWVLAKLVTTTVMTGLVLFALRPTLLAATELGAALPVPERQQLVIASTVATTLLVLNTALSSYKPWGRTRRGARARAEARPEASRRTTVSAGSAARG
jgi:hypothetical protein